MGIVYNYLALTPELLAKAVADRDLAESLIHIDSDHPTSGQPGVLARVDVDKGWDGAAYLLSAERRATDDLYLPGDPLAQGVLGREAVLGDGWFEVGHEPRILSPTEVRSIARALAPLTHEDLRPRYNVEAMRAADVYSAGASAEYFLNAFDVLQAFYAEAANAGAAVVIYTS